MSDASKKDHSLDMKNQLLTSLDNGRVQKALRAGWVNYTTRYTVWAGTQPARFDLWTSLRVKPMLKEEIPDSAVHLLCFSGQLWVLHGSWPSAKDGGIAIEYVIGSLGLRHSNLDVLTFHEVFELPPWHRSWIIFKLIQPQYLRTPHIGELMRARVRGWCTHGRQDSLASNRNSWLCLCRPLS